MQTFLVCHALSCRNVGLVIVHHNEMQDMIIHLTRQSFSPHCIRSKPLIHLVPIRSEERVRCGGRVLETRAGVSIQGLWEIQTEAIIYVVFGDSDAETWKP